MSKRTSVGGQAVIEGVMMRGSDGIATAVRTPGGEIVIDKRRSIPFNKRYKILGIPVMRGFVALIESLIEGIKTLNYSASFFEEEEELSKFEKWFQGIFKEKTNDIIMGFSLVISLIFSIGLFFILPTFAANLFIKLGVEGTVILNIVEGIIRISIFLLYIFFIGKMEDIKRVFQYHGAEHKTIFCYEAEEELIPENVKKYGRLHPRCGTNFLFLVMIVSIMIFSLTGWDTIWQRIISRVLLLPIVSGITYELIKWLGKNDNFLSKIISYPGLMLQKLTTEEPDFKQIEVAIKALKSAEGIEEEMVETTEELLEGEKVEDVNGSVVRSL